MNGSAAVVDVAFELAGSTLPADHAETLAAEVARWLPWVEDEPGAGIHPLRAPASAHGAVVLARRAKLVLRVPAARAGDSRALCGRELRIADSSVVTGSASERQLAPSATLYAQVVVTGAGDELAFQLDVERWLAEVALRCEFIAGRARRVKARGRELLGYGLALHGLAPDDSLRAQAAGIGVEHRLGCGIFVPHKAIATA